MSILSDMVKGFMWGIGFSIALFGAATAYIMNIYAAADAKLQGESVNKLLNQSQLS